jgi:hypothetical protein
MLRYQDGEVVKHHALHGDFSRWIYEVLQDAALGEIIALVERDLARNVSPSAIETARVRILRAIEDRYLARPRLAQAPTTAVH